MISLSRLAMVGTPRVAVSLNLTSPSGHVNSIVFWLVPPRSRRSPLHSQAIIKGKTCISVFGQKPAGVFHSNCQQSPGSMPDRQDLRNDSALISYATGSTQSSGFFKRHTSGRSGVFPKHACSSIRIQSPENALGLALCNVTGGGGHVHSSQGHWLSAALWARHVLHLYRADQGRQRRGL